MDVIINNPANAAPYQGQVYAAPQGYGPGFGPGYGHDHHGPGFGFFVLLIGAIVFFKAMKRRRWMEYRMARGEAPTEGKAEFKKDFFERKGWWSKPDNAMDIARERYARGEISLEELEVIKKALG